MKPDIKKLSINKKTISNLTRSEMNDSAEFDRTKNCENTKGNCTHTCNYCTAGCTCTCKGSFCSSDTA